MTSRSSPLSPLRLARFEGFCAFVGLELEDFQRLILGEFFAGRRELLCLLPRGNGKTTLFSALALFHLLTTPEPAAYCAAVLARDGHRYRYCGQPAGHVDHIVPVSRGGTDNPASLAAACARCNLVKGDC